MKTLSYSVLLERLGPLPTVSQVGEFLGGNYMRAHVLIEQGKLEAITTTGKKRIVLNSLFDYLLNLEAQEELLASRRAAINSDIIRIEEAAAK